MPASKARNMPEWEDELSISFEQHRLHDASQAGNFEECKTLLEQKFDPNAFDDLGKTPLHYAAEGEHLEVMRLLLDSGADVNAHDESVIGNTTLGEVAGNCSLAVAKLLIEAGADPTIQGWMQLTAVDKARERKRSEGPRVSQLLETAARKFASG
jgi:ankyrin repeat protein